MWHKRIPWQDEDVVRTILRGASLQMGVVIADETKLELRPPQLQYLGHLGHLAGFLGVLQDFQSGKTATSWAPWGRGLAKR